jgi:hypothetical protein
MVPMLLAATIVFFLRGIFGYAEFLASSVAADGVSCGPPAS